MQQGFTTFVRWLLLALLATGCGATPIADLPEDARVPLPTTMRHGTLDNGLTYYIRPHARPRRTAQIWLVVQAGSAHEDHDQRGLAHLVEHLAFSGTRRFPRRAIFDFIRRAGPRAGAHVNARTGLDRTVYQLQVPSNDIVAVAGSFQILRDWMTAIRFDPVELDNERRVVAEEQRWRLGSDSREQERWLAEALAGTCYADRHPFGLPEVIASAPREALLRYYRDWYRLDRMAIIVVGDVEPSAIETRIRAVFEGLPRPGAARQAPAIVLPQQQPRVLVTVDPEREQTTVELDFVARAAPQHRAGDLRTWLAERLLDNLLRSRLESERDVADAPLFSVRVEFRQRLVGVAHRSLAATVPDDGVARGVAALGAALARAERQRLTAGELERARQRLLLEVERAVNLGHASESRLLAQELEHHHLVGQPVLDPPQRSALMRRLLPTIGLADVAAVAARWRREANVLVSISSPLEVARPPDQELIALALPSTAASKTPGADDASFAPHALRLPLVVPERPPGKVVSEGVDAEGSVVTWMLANGARVVVVDLQRGAPVGKGKVAGGRWPTVWLEAYAPGGQALAAPGTLPSARYAMTLARLGGLANLDAAGLARLEDASRFTMRASIGRSEVSVVGEGAAAALHEMLQRMVAHFLPPRRDAAALESWRRRETARLAHRGRDPSRAFEQRFREFVVQGDPWAQTSTVEALAAVDPERALRFYADTFADAGRFTFVLIGHFDRDALQELVERTLGSLPGKADPARDAADRAAIAASARPWRVTGDLEVRLGDAPRATTILRFSSAWPWSMALQEDARALRDLLRMRLNDVLRQELAGTYAVDVEERVQELPQGQVSLEITFSCAPDRQAALEQAALRELAAIRSGTIPEALVESLRAGERRLFEAVAYRPMFRVRPIVTRLRHGLPPLGASADQGHAATLARLTVAHLQQTAQRLLPADRMLRAVHLPTR